MCRKLFLIAFVAVPCGYVLAGPPKCSDRGIASKAKCTQVAKASGLCAFDCGVNCGRVCFSGGACSCNKRKGNSCHSQYICRGKSQKSHKSHKSHCSRRCEYIILGVVCGIIGLLLCFCGVKWLRKKRLARIRGSELEVVHASSGAAPEHA